MKNKILFLKQIISHYFQSPINSYRSSTTMNGFDVKAVERVYDAFLNKDADPKHHQKLCNRLKKDWPSLYSALSELNVSKMNYSYTITNIWKYKDNA